MTDSQPKLSFTLDFDSPEFIDNPYVFYRSLREEAPVYQTPQGYWYLTRYDDVKSLMTNRNVIRDRPEYVSWIKVDNDKSNEFERLISEWMVFKDPPAHTCLRETFQPFLTPGIIDSLQPVIMGAIQEQISQLKKRKKFDVVNDYSLPIALKVVCRLLEIPEEDYLLFKPRARTIAMALDKSRDEVTKEFSSTFSEMRSYLDRLYSNKKHFASNSIASLWEAGDLTFDRDELISHIIFLMWAGHETTWVSVSNGMLCLLNQPDIIKKLKDDPDLIEPVYEEVLRLESPVQKSGRWTTEPVYFGDIEIPGDAYVVGLIGAANRDPEQFPDPDSISLDRSKSGQMAFTFGIHNCMGARLARFEGAMAIRALIENYPDIRLAEEKPQWRKFDGLRGLETLPVIVN